MNNIQNYGIRNYQMSSPNFKSKQEYVIATKTATSGVSDRIAKKLGNFLVKFTDKLSSLSDSINDSRTVKIEPAKDYKELNSILKTNIRINTFLGFFDKLAHFPLLLLPKEMRPRNNSKEVMEMGYKFGQENKGDLGKLTFQAVCAQNPDYLRGIAKALKESGLI